MVESVPSEKRAEWQTWVEHNIGGDGPTIQRATDAALASLLGGHSTDDAISAARSAARAGSSEAEAERHPVSDADHLRGVVSIFRERNELMGNQYGSVWSFRLDRWDSTGAPEPPVAVEMRGYSFSGSVGQGDWVEIPGREILSRWKPGEIFHAQLLKNITMNSTVTADPGLSSRIATGRGIGSPARAVVFLIVIALIATVVLYVIFFQSSGSPVPRQIPRLPSLRP